MHHLTAFAGLLVMPTHTWTEAFALLLRWVHFLAGITWIGLLYFFNLVNVPFMKQVDAGMKPKVFQYMTLPTLQWFRWSALLTVLVGFWRSRRSWLRGRISFSPCQCCSLWPPVHTTRYWGVEALPEPESRCADTCFHTKNVGLATGP